MEVIKPHKRKFSGKTTKPETKKGEEGFITLERQKKLSGVGRKAVEKQCRKRKARLTGLRILRN